AKMKSVDDVIASLQQQNNADSKAAVLSENDRRAIQSALNDPKKGMNLGQLSDEQIDQIVKASGGSSAASVLSALEAITKDGNGSKLKSVDDVIAALQTAKTGTATSTATATATPTVLSATDRQAIRAALNDPKKGMNLGQVSDEQIDRIVKASGGTSAAT